jgi:hypothetical protein
MFLKILMTIQYVLAFMFDHSFRRSEMTAMIMAGVDRDDAGEISRRHRVLDQALRSAGRTL